MNCMDCGGAECICRMLRDLAKLTQRAEAAERQVAELKREIGERDGRIKKLADGLLAWESMEASLCPEDVGFAEYIKALRAQLQEAQKDTERLDWLMLSGALVAFSDDGDVCWLYWPHPEDGDPLTYYLRLWLAGKRYGVEMEREYRSKGIL